LSARCWLQLSRRKGDSAKVLYTADSRSLASDEIFVEFVTGSHDAFVVEDADHILDATSELADMYRNGRYMADNS
jgi:hypothetical protein